MRSSSWRTVIFSDEATEPMRVFSSRSVAICFFDAFRSSIRCSYLNGGGIEFLFHLFGQLAFAQLIHDIGLMSRMEKLKQTLFKLADLIHLSTFSSRPRVPQ